MQYIVLMSAKTEPLQDGDWVINGIKRKGTLQDAVAAISAARFREKGCCTATWIQELIWGVAGRVENMKTGDAEEKVFGL